MITKILLTILQIVSCLSIGNFYQDIGLNSSEIDQYVEKRNMIPQVDPLSPDIDPSRTYLEYITRNGKAKIFWPPNGKLYSIWNGDKLFLQPPKDYNEHIECIAYQYNYLGKEFYCRFECAQKEIHELYECNGWGIDYYLIDERGHARLQYKACEWKRW